MPSVVVRQTVNHLLETAYLKGAIDRTWPSQVYIDITSRCNCRCVMCHVWKSEPADELSTQAWVDVLRDIARWPGPGTKVNISGGEPLLRADLPELLGEAARLGLAVGFVTNGSLITEELAATIVDSGVFNVNVSLDSLDPAIHDRLRGVAGATAKALAAFEHLAAAAARRPDRPVALVVKTTIMEPTLDGLLDIVEFAAAEGLSGVLFQPLSPTFRGEQRERWYDDDPLWVRDPRKAAAVIDELVIGKECGLPILDSVDHLRTIATYLADPEREGSGTCRVGSSNLSIWAHGDVPSLCRQLERADLGNAPTDSLHDIWTGGQAKGMRNAILYCTRNCALTCQRSRSLVEKAQLYLQLRQQSRTAQAAQRSASSWSASSCGSSPRASKRW